MPLVSLYFFSFFQTQQKTDLLQAIRFHSTNKSRVINLQLNIAVSNLTFKFQLFFLEKKNIKLFGRCLFSSKIAVLCSSGFPISTLKTGTQCCQRPVTTAALFSSKRAVLPGRNDAVTSHANRPHSSA